ncbi:cytochrome b561 and DOMON domain-containing protein At3g07570-like [Eucalyptus grandis]|uniref:cytochrome b561 and DOMON domain-containing protein At3g07570-like n=1 Tax=Eucalyptus grandis TaxID=71139 RepID=UPI000526BD63|nr:cytochrome b561 and DOMON domain-containing protein At3g07570-like [Eucalyptus grandis]
MAILKNGQLLKEQYHKISANKWEFLLSTPFTDSYIAMGFLKNGQMVGSSAMVRWVSSGVFVMKGAGQTTTESRRYTGLRRSHGILNILGWSILMIAGIIVARHCKQYDPMWFYVHAAVQSSAFVLGLLGIICGFVLENKISASSVSTHKGLGIFILFLGCLQVMAIWVRPRKGLKVREYWNWYHQNVGRVLIIFAIANVFYGIHLGEEGKKWNLAYGISIGVLSVILIVLEIPKFRK